MKASFFQSLWGVCCGTRIFPVLAGHSTLRTLWHLALMSLLAALIVTVAGAGRWRSAVGRCEKDFTSAFGASIELSPQGIVPEKAPAVPFSLGLPSLGTLFYTDGATGVKWPGGFFSGSWYFLVWSDRLIAAGSRSSAAEWQLQSVDPDQQVRTVQAAPAAIPGLLAAEFARIPAGSRWQLPRTRLETRGIFAVIERVFIATALLGEFFTCLVMALLCTGCFALFSRFTGAAALRGLSGGAYWRVGIYAGFPGMLIGSVCEALELPLLSYRVVYAVALVVYWLPAALACGGGETGDGA